MILHNREFEKRVEHTQKLLVDSPWDAVLVFSTESEPAGVRYYSDYWPSFETAAVLIPRHGDAALVIGPESLRYAKSRSKLERIIQMMDFRESSQPAYPGSVLPSWKDVLGEFQVKQLGIAGWHMFPWSIMLEIVEALGAKEQVANADELIRKVMMKKSAAEIECLREAARISEVGFRAVLEKIRPGMTETALCGIAIEAMLAEGAESVGYPIWCCSGPNSNQAISRPSLRPVERGEIIHFSIGAKVEGYSASVGRPIVLGQCPDAIRSFLQVGLDACNMTFDLMRAGTFAADVAKKVHQFVRDSGYGDTLLYGPAHGCGQMECEFPFLETSSEYILEEGMTFMADMFLGNDRMGFRWEDGLVVRDGPAEQLSSFGRMIHVLEC